MNIAFYAPLKPPDSPVPSGDRLIARMLIAALEAGGHHVRIVSKLRTFDRDGDAQRQARIAGIGKRMQARVLRRLRCDRARPDIWLTYHLYHKAPDWIGPAVAAELGIPYCVAEASLSPRQAGGAWAAGHRAVVDALSRARLVININPKDEAGVRMALSPRARAVTIAPFIDGAVLRAARHNRAQLRRQLSAKYRLDMNVPWLLAVGMLRPGDKQRSYGVLAAAAAMLLDRPWRLLIVGDGAARGEIEREFATSAGRSVFIGKRSEAEVADMMAACDLLTWPAVNEAIGMVFVEAAMAGLPAVGADRPGIAAIVEHGVTGLLVPEHDCQAFAAATARLLDDRPLRQALSEAAARHAAAHHDIATAGGLFCRQLEAVPG